MRKAVCSVIVLALIAVVFAGGGLSSPSITGYSPSANPHTYVGDSQPFSVSLNESANITWYVNGSADTLTNNTTTSSYSNSTLESTVGTHTITVVAANPNGTVNHSWTWTVSYTPLQLSSKSPSSPTTTTVGQSITFSIQSNQNVNFEWYVNDGTTNTSVQNNTSTTTASYTPSSTYTDSTGTYTVVVRAINTTSGLSQSESWTWTVSYAPLQLSSKSPSSPTTTTVGQSITFSIQSNQNVNFEWYVNDGTTNTSVQNNTSTTTASYTPSSTYTDSTGTYTVVVRAINTTSGLSQSESWTWKVASATYYTGDSVWREGEDSTTYTWTNQSFAGFYYDIDSNVGSEQIVFRNIDVAGRRVAKGNIEYSTTAAPTSYNYSAWGTYNVIGFMAEKYFAGYLNNPAGTGTASPISQGHLHKVLMDTNDKKSISMGSSLQLKEGYELSVREVDINGNRALVELKKDGKVVDTGFVGSNEDYIYKKDVGGTSDLPIIIVHVGSVFRGTETNAVFVEGIFQISDSYTSVESGARYGIMEVSSYGSSTIKMTSDSTLSLSRGSTTTLMGNIKVLVADSSTLRFKLAIDVFSAGLDYVRGTVATGTFKWTPYNFEGFYYDLDSDTKSESLEVKSLSGRTIPTNGVVYTATAATATYEYSAWGTYNVIGFMAEKYFAGYLNNPAGTGTASPLSQGHLHKVLMDTNDKKSIYVGSSLQLKEGYELSVREVDINGNRALVELKKDGKVVDTGFVGSNEDYIYKKDVGGTSDLPIIIVHVGSVFRGTETNAVFVEGIFQISDSYTSVQSGAHFKQLEVVSVGSNSITLQNDNSITLTAGSSIDLLGNVWIRVADDSSALRYFPYVPVEELPQGALPMSIDVPSTLSKGVQVSIHVVSGISDVEGAGVYYDGKLIGTTNATGVLTYTPSEAGTHTIEARRYGYASASKQVEVVGEPLELSAPKSLNLGDVLVVQVALGGKPVEGVSIMLGNEDIGTTNAAGTLTYTTTKAGKFTLKAEKAGYIPNSTQLEVIGPYASLEITSLSVEPRTIRSGESVEIVANITNTGNIKGSREIRIELDGKPVHTENITLMPSATFTLRHTQKIEGKGVHTLGVGGNLVSVMVEGSAFPVALVAAGGVIGGAVIVVVVLVLKGVISLGGAGGGQALESIRQALGRLRR